MLTRKLTLIFRLVFVTTNLALRLTARQKCINLPRAYLIWNVQGIDCHIGSQLTSIDPFIDATDRLLALIDDLKHKASTFVTSTLVVV